MYAGKAHVLPIRKQKCEGLVCLKYSQRISAGPNALLTDSLKVFSAIEGDEVWVIRRFVMDILDLSKCFSSIEFGTSLEF